MTELKERLREVITSRPIDVDTRVRIQLGYVNAGGPSEDVTWGELPEDVRAMVERAETLPPTPNADPYGSHRWTDNAVLQRISDAVGAHQYGPVNRDAIVQAWSDTADPTWGNLPPEIRTMIEDIETFLPRTGWDDPADAPEDDDLIDTLLADDPVAA